MLDERKASILRAVVEEYIQTAQPVGSSHVAGRAGLNVSSATVRNEMGQLERDGYLAQPHTSAGRVPTDKGYRFFVDSITDPGELDANRSMQVRAFFDRAHGELERMLADTSRLLSGLTDYASVVVAPNGVERPTIRSVQLVAISARAVLVVAVLSNGTVEKRTLDVEAAETVVAAASGRVAALWHGVEWGSAVAVTPSGDAAVDDLVGRASAALSAPVTPTVGEPGQVWVGGAARMAAAFDAVGTIRQVLTIMEQQYVLVSLIRDVLDRGLSVAIGTEHGVAPLADCSLVVAPYEVEGDRGTIAILGPTRMHYEQALAAVGVVSQHLGRALREGA